MLLKCTFVFSLINVFMVIIVNVMIFHVQEKMILFVRVWFSFVFLCRKFIRFNMCKGPDHGICGCDKRCQCRIGWTGDDCSCTTNTDTCLVNNVK